MTFPEMITFIENHYSSATKEKNGGNAETYDVIHASMIKEFLDKFGIDYAEAAKRVIFSHSKSFRILPDAAIFRLLFDTEKEQKEKEHALEKTALYWYCLITKKANALNDVIIGDIRAQKAIENMGGWVAFCHRDAENEFHHRREFCRLFKLFNGCDEQPKTLSGEYQKNPLIEIRTDENKMIDKTSEQAKMSKSDFDVCGYLATTNSINTIG